MDTEENQENQTHTSPFETIRRVDEHGQEFWNARDMAKLLGYTEFGKFKRAIERAEKACAAVGATACLCPPTAAQARARRLPMSHPRERILSSSCIR